MDTYGLECSFNTPGNGFALRVNTSEKVIR